jgi:hypothetical protein
MFVVDVYPYPGGARGWICQQKRPRKIMFVVDVCPHPGRRASYYSFVYKTRAQALIQTTNGALLDQAAPSSTPACDQDGWTHHMMMRIMDAGRGGEDG